MTQRERQILHLIEADPMISQEALADKLGISRSYVSRIEKKVLEQLKNAFEQGKG